jgi:hypothetical protein
LESALKAIIKIRALVTLVVVPALLLFSVQGSAEKWSFSGIERVVSVSDVHGALGGMTATLSNAGLLDESLGWSGGKAHLVITGDILDRGPDSRKVMDLLMRIEGEALAAGGQVHLLLGNHEVMNLVGDLRYVSKEEYAAFADDELSIDRDRWFRKFSGSRPKNIDQEALRSEFDGKYSPGFFGLRRAFSSEGAYGPWLMSKPMLVVINGTAYVHGGMSPLVAELGLDGVNQQLRLQVTEYVTQTEILFERGILDPTDNFYAHAEILESLPVSTGSSRPQHIQAAIEAVIKLNGASVHGPNSPLWYRGSVGCGPLIEEDKLAAALAAINANRVVIGHTPTLTRRVLQRMDGRVVQIDTGMLTKAYQGSGNALVIEGDSIMVVAEKSSVEYQPVDHPRRVGFRSDKLTAERLEEILSQGEVTPTSTPESGKTIVNVTHFGENITAVFEENGRSKNVYPDLAAYRLDRMLGLDMVPVTVARELGGRQGSLQFIPGSMLNDEDRAAKSRGGAAWCPLADQWQAMYVFDSLIYNQGRQRSNMLYSIDNWQLILANHKHSFTTNKGLPTYVANTLTQSGGELVLGSGWKKALAALTEDYLTEQLGDVLDKRRIKALADRSGDLLDK